jgi:ABC-2 type transport system ATP-binding protein
MQAIPPSGGASEAPATEPAVAIKGLGKQYASGFEALRDVHLDIRRGEIFGLLGPNGAGKTTLISIICGLVHPSSGSVQAAGHDIQTDFRAARWHIGLVPQELTTDAFESVWGTVSFSRGLFGRAPDDDHIERVLRDLSLWDKRNNALRTLSGGMKRRVLIAKALAHEPSILFLDEPTAGVDVELRREMWALVRRLREQGVTIILTTHYIAEAEEMADRVGVINDGELILVEQTNELMRKLGRKRLTLNLSEPLAAVPAGLERHELSLADDGHELIFHYDAHAEHPGIHALLRDLERAGIAFSDLHTSQSSLEEIFVDLVSEAS